MTNNTSMRTGRLNVTSLSLVVCMSLGSMTALVSEAGAAAIRTGVPGFTANTFGPNDDGTYPETGTSAGDPGGGSTAQPLGFTANFYGINRTSAFINNNGNVTFDAELATYTPFDLTSTGREIIAPFFADVDTRFAGDPVTFGQGTVGGRDAFAVNWINVDYFSSSSSHTNRNSFQLVLIDRSDTGSGNFDIEFNYDQIEWEAGTASDANSDGLGGNTARVGFSNGTGDPGTFFELAGSAVDGAFLDSGPAGTSLINNSLNSSVDGRYIFEARNGEITTPTEVPEPGVLAMFGVGLASIGFVARRRKTA